MPSNMAATASAVADVDQATVYRKMLFPLPRAFEQCHAGIKTGCGNRPTEWTRLLVQEPMHHHAVQHHHDGISDLRGPACISRLLSCSCPRHRIQHTRLEPLAVDFAHKSVVQGTAFWICSAAAAPLPSSPRNSPALFPSVMQDPASVEENDGTGTQRSHRICSATTRPRPGIA
jgi:hypothetical protein